MAGQSGMAQTFQWMETATGEMALMSLATNCFLCIDPQTGDIRADSPCPMPDYSDGALCLVGIDGRQTTPCEHPRQLLKDHT